MASLGLKRELSVSYADVLEKIGDALQSEGFGVLTEIDVSATLKQKLDVTFRPYKILGACNPPLAHKALQADLQMGLMMPCNVVVYENDDGKATILAIDPKQTMAASPDAPQAIKEVAEQVRHKLERVLEKI